MISKEKFIVLFRFQRISFGKDEAPETHNLIRGDL